MNRYAAGEQGEYAASPRELPPRGWWRVLLRVRHELGADNISIVAAGVAFYGFLAIFPALAALAMLYAAVASPQDITRQIAPLQEVMPAAAYEIIHSQIIEVADSGGASLGLGAALSLLFAVWSSTKGVKSLMTAMNISYEETENRGLVMLNVTAFILTVGAILFVLAALFVIAAIPPIVRAVGFGVSLESAVLWLRWLVMFALLVLGISLLYRWAPNRRSAKLRWVTPGALVAAVLWLVASVAFSFYVQNFGRYNETFGSLGAVVILLLWLYISAYVACLGAELNSELERRTYRDSTSGLDRPLGRRGAVVADQPPPDRQAP